MTKNTIWTIVGVAAAVLIALWIVNTLLSLLWFVVKVALVVAVAVAVFAVLRALVARSRG